MQALDRAKRLTSALGKLDERRERAIAKANSDFRLDLMAAVDSVDAETIGLVQRALAMDRVHEHLQYSLQLMLDERSESTRRSRVAGPGASEDDPHEAETLSPPPLPTGLDDGDEDVVVIDDDAAVFGRQFEALAQADKGDDLPAGYRYPEPGEAAIELPDGRVVAAP